MKQGAHLWAYDHFALPPQHRYPRGRLTLVREALLADGGLRTEDITPADPTAWDTLSIVHTDEYLRRLQEGALSRAEQLELGVPFSPELVERARAAVNATIAATRHALVAGAAANMGGGNHHGFADHGSGYCVLNDIAVAIRVARREGLAERVAIIDLDVHQGNGNAVIFDRDPDVFTFSTHGAGNWPYQKATSDLDIALPDGTGDTDYLAAVEPAVTQLLERFRPDLVFYQAGVDPLASDRLGRLALTHDGLRCRDEFVLTRCQEAHVPIVVTLGGGYSQPLSDSVAAHATTLRTMARMWPVA